MNRLELALTDPSNVQLDLYLDESLTKQIRSDIEDIRRKSAISTDAGKLREELLTVLNR